MSPAYWETSIDGDYEISDSDDLAAFFVEFADRIGPNVVAIARNLEPGCEFESGGIHVRRIPDAEIP
jgi:hypothetical protein